MGGGGSGRTVRGGRLHCTNRRHREVKSGRPGKAAALNAFKIKYPHAHCVVIDWEKGKKLLAMEKPKSIREDVGILLDL
jgi:hypothetical protein